MVRIYRTNKAEKDQPTTRDADDDCIRRKEDGITYTVTVNGDLVKDLLLGPTEDSDALDDTTITGTVTGSDHGSFRFFGDVVGLELDGQTSDILEDANG